MGNKNSIEECIPLKYLDNVPQNKKLILELSHFLSGNPFSDLQNFNIHKHLEYILNVTNYINHKFCIYTVEYLKILLLKNPSLVYYQNERGEDLLNYFFQNCGKRFSYIEENILYLILDFNPKSNITNENGLNSFTLSIKYNLYNLESVKRMLEFEFQIQKVIFHYLSGSINDDKKEVLKLLIHRRFLDHEEIIQYLKYPTDFSIFMLDCLIEIDYDLNRFDDFNLIYYPIRYQSDKSHLIIEKLIQLNKNIDFYVENIKFIDYINFLIRIKNIDKKIIEILFLNQLI